MRCAVNAEWRRGMYSSVRVGLAAALPLRPSAVLVLPVLWTLPETVPGRARR